MPTTTRRRSRSSSIGGVPEDLERRPSPETAMMLLLLAVEGPMDYAELAWRLGVEPRRVRDRARYFAAKGWIEKNSPFITLTELGLEYVEKYAFYLARVASTRYGEYALSILYTLSSLSGGKERTNAEKGGLTRTRVEKSGERRTTSDYARTMQDSVKRQDELGSLIEELFSEFVEPCARRWLGRELEPEERDLLLLLLEAYVRRPYNPYLKLDDAALLERFGSIEPYASALRELVDAGIVFMSKRGRLYRLDRSCTPPTPTPPSSRGGGGR